MTVLESFLSWRVHRALVERIGYAKPFSKIPRRKRILFVSARDPICHTQLFPFFLYEKVLEGGYGIEVRELPLNHFQARRNSYGHEVDAVLFQTWFDLKADQLRNLVERIKLAWPNAKIGYLDWFAPTDLRFAEVLDQDIAAYVKKQTLKKFELYKQATIGDTNLTDYYGRRSDIQLPRTQFHVPADFEKKIFLGAGFEYSPQVLKNLNQPLYLGARTIDMHARIATKGTPWYSYMRGEALAAVEKLKSNLNVAYAGRVPSHQYLAELRDSKLCFRPFGYGEVCWRDFEAMGAGAVLLKPDMSHLKLANDYFRPFETYVPLSWDLSDLREKAEYYIQNHAERKAISENAFEQLRQHYKRGQFTKDVEGLWKLLGFTTVRQPATPSVTELHRIFAD